MKDPPHPGETVRELCLEPTNLTITDAAKKLGVRSQAFLRFSQLQNRYLPRDGDPDFQSLRR